MYYNTNKINIFGFSALIIFGLQFLAKQQVLATRSNNLLGIFP